MKREPILVALQNHGLAFQKGRYVKGLPRLSGATADECIQSELIGTPNLLRIFSLTAAWTTAEQKTDTLAALKDVAALVYPAEIEQVHSAIDAAIPEIEALPNAPKTVADFHLARLTLLVGKVPGARILMARIEWRLMP